MVTFGPLSHCHSGSKNAFKFYLQSGCIVQTLSELHFHYPFVSFMES